MESKAGFDCVAHWALTLACVKIFDTILLHVDEQKSALSSKYLSVKIHLDLKTIPKFWNLDVAQFKQKVKKGLKKNNI